MRFLTLRGRVKAGETKRLIVDDGRLTSAMKVIEFNVWAKSINSSDDPECILGLEYNMGSEWDAGDNRQIAWGGQTTTNTTRLMGFNLIDPRHLVIQDLWIYNFAATADANYMIVLEPVTISDDESIIHMIKERSQNASR